MTVIDQAQSLRELVRRTSVDDSAVQTDVGAQTGTGGGTGGGGAINVQRRRATIVTIASGKGGVGKTNIAVNLAAALARRNCRVTLLDADLGTANADVLCNINATRNVAHVISGQCSLQQVMIQAPGGFTLVPGASGLANMAALGDNDRLGLIARLHELDARSDIILIDTAAGISPNVLSFACCANQLLVVTTPEPTAITDAYALIKTVYHRCKDVDVRLLVNMVHDESEGRHVFKRIDAVCRRFLQLEPVYAGHILFDRRLTTAVYKRRLFVLDNPRSPASRSIARLAQHLHRQLGIRQRRGAHWWRRLLDW